jgi:hypothetical protein
MVPLNLKEAMVTALSKQMHGQTLWHVALPVHGAVALAIPMQRWLSQHT